MNVDAWITRHPRIAAAAVLFSLGSACIAIGIAIDRWILMPKPTEGRLLIVEPPPGVLPGSPPGAFGRPQLFLPFRFEEELDLTPAQRTQLQAILSEHMMRLRSAREMIRPRIDSVVGDVREKVDSILTPEQRRKLDEMRRKAAESGRLQPRQTSPPGAAADPSGGTSSA